MARTYSPPRMSSPQFGQWMPFEVGTSVSHFGHSIHCSVASYRRTAASASFSR